MWNVVKVSASNFLSFVEFTKEFTPDFALITGKNLDEIESARSNGSGKSSFINAIVFGLFGETIDGKSPSALVRNGCDWTDISIELRNKDDVVLIERRLFPKKSQILRIAINGERPSIKSNSTTGGVDVVAGQQFIYDLIGISKEDVFAFYIKSGGGDFCGLTDRKRLDIINRLVGMEIVEEALERLRNYVNKGRVDIDLWNRELDGLRKILLEIEDLREAEHVKFKAERDGRIAELKRQWKEREKIGEAPDRLERKDISKLQTEYDLWQKAKFHLSKPVVKCPSCGHTISEDVEKWKTVRNPTGELEQAREHNQKCAVRESEIRNYESRFAEQKRQRDKLLGEIEKVKRMEFDDESFNVKRKDTQEAFDKLRIKISDNGELLNLNNNWIKYFISFKHFVATSLCEMIEVRVNEYLDRQKSGYSVKMEAFKTLRSGLVREGITPVIYKDGDVSYMSLSAGEAARVNLSFDLALQDVLNGRTTGLNLYISDEALSNLDDLGIENIVKNFSFGRQILLCTHSAPELTTKKEIKIVKSRGVSKLVNEE